VREFLGDRGAAGRDAGGEGVFGAGGDQPFLAEVGDAPPLQVPAVQPDAGQDLMPGGLVGQVGGRLVAALAGRLDGLVMA